MMTDERRKWLEDSIASMQAEREGRNVQFRSTVNGTWGRKSPGNSYFYDVEYRPEPIPKYRPFTLEESGKLLTCAVRSAYDGQLFETDGIVKGPISWDVVVRVNHAQTMKVAVHDMCERFTFADTGKPCGVLVEGDDA